uniref:Uncharacterized protein n=1 Tax=Arundo donax TaxID=35708 RepID=A0A0A8Z7F0_ARUDO
MNWLNPLPASAMKH